MKFTIKAGIAGLVAAFGISLLFMPAFAVPLTNFSWTAPTNYEDGTVIDFVQDPLTYAIYCSATSGGPYLLVANGLNGEAANGLDVGVCVNGTPGTYYFVATAYSPLYGEESQYSGEASRTYTAVDLGKVPNPPTLISVD